MNSAARRRLLVMMLCTLGFWKATPAQMTPATILEIDIKDQTRYSGDNSDVSKLATDPNRTTPNVPSNFFQFVTIGDIVAVNGQPAKGTATQHARQILLRTAPVPGQAIADTMRDAAVSFTFEILRSDGTPIGTIMASGLGVGSAPPGAPLQVTQGNNSIVGGTGAFLGARGQVGQAVSPQTVPVRQASMTEDPANRRQIGGGRVRFVCHLIPMSRPEIVNTSGGPAIVHSSDFSLVSAARPAAPGETLSLFATGLGPTFPGVDPGKPFPSSPLAAVNSPVDVTVNGKSAEVLAAVAFPGAVDGYQVNFQVPPDTAKGTATIQVSVAWIVGSAVSIPVQ